MTLPQVNATLTAVTGATAATSGRDDWDNPGGAEPAGAGAEKWSGRADAYYREAVRRNLAGEGPTVLAARVLILESSVARAAGIDTDDVLTFIGPDGLERTARASVVAVRELAGMPAELQTARLELEEA